jgi:hypothetical protein
MYWRPVSGKVYIYTLVQNGIFESSIKGVLRLLELQCGSMHILMFRAPIEVVTMPAALWVSFSKTITL